MLFKLDVVILLILHRYALHLEKPIRAALEHGRLSWNKCEALTN